MASIFFFYKRPDTKGDNNFMHKMKSREAAANLKTKLEIWRLIPSHSQTVEVTKVNTAVPYPHHFHVSFQQGLTPNSVRLPVIQNPLFHGSTDLQSFYFSLSPGGPTDFFKKIFCSPSVCISIKFFIITSVGNKQQNEDCHLKYQ